MMSYHLKPTAITTAAILAVTVWATAQTPVNVGRGSYASTPPSYKSKTDAHDGCRAMAVETARLWIDGDGERPIPTNDWWTDMLNNRFADALWSLPAMVHPSEEGATVNYPKTWSPNGTELQWSSGITLGAGNYTADAAIAADWGDWHVVMRMPATKNPNQQIKVTLMHGTPLTWAEYQGGLIPAISFSATPELFGQADGCMGVAIGNDLYGLYFAPGAEATMRADILEIEGSAYVVAALLRTRDDLKTFARYARAVPRQTQLTWSYDEGQSTLTTRWHVEAADIADGSPATEVLQGFLPHAVKSALSKPSTIGTNYQTPRGKMRLSAGNDFSFSYRFTGILPYFAMPGQEAAKGEHPYRPERMKELVEAYADKGTFGDDTYWGGKGLVQMAINMMIARDNGLTETFEKSRKALRGALEDWLTYKPGEQQRFFAYYPRWGSLVGFNVSYDSDAFNDHHFHYGYFVYAGALLCMADPEFARDYGDMLRLLVKDYANYDHSDTRFPFLRTLDPWAGHSYAGGLGDHVNSNGNGQESSSEAMQSWGGVFMLGVALGDKELRDAGIMGWLTESNGTAEYWFDRDHIYPDREANYDYEKYESPYCTNLTSKGIGWWTWFSGDPIWMHSIQWMPVSPCLNYLSRDLNFAKWDYEKMIGSTEHRWFESHGENGPLADESLGNVVLCYLERTDPEQAAQIFDRAYDENRGMARGIDTGHISYYTIHSHRTVGDIDWEVWADSPTATAYRRQDGSMTYVVYNSPDNDRERTVNFYRGSTLERSVKMRAGEGMVAFTGEAVPDSISLDVTGGTPLAPGDAATITAAVRDQYGATTGDAVTLVVASGDATLDGNVLKVSPSAAKGSEIILTAAGAGLSRTLAIEVNERPVATSISMMPNPAYLLTGTTVNFKVEVKDQYGKPMDSAVTFSENAPGGVFTATEAGRSTITASVGDLTASHSLVAVPSLPDLALHRPVTASSFENAGTVPENATDGDDGSRWGSNHTDDEWIYVELERECGIVNVSVKWEAAFAKAYDIELSDDAKTWRTAAAVTGVSGAGWVSTPVDGKARYVRIHGRERGSNYGYSFYTLRVEGIDAGVSPDALAGIAITAPEMMEEGSGTTLSARGITYAGDVTDIANPVWSLWDASGNEIRNAFKGNEFTPPVYGMLTLRAEAAEFTAERNILVTESVKPVSLEVEAASSTVIVGHPLQFEISAKNQFGGQWPVDVDNIAVSVEQDGNPVDNDSFDRESVSFTPGAPGAYSLEFAETVHELRDTVGVKAVNLADMNLALGCRAWASSVRDGNAASGVTDGETAGRRWESNWGNDNEWIAIDLGKTYELQSVRFVWEGAYAKDYDIETSLDGDTWVPAERVENSAGGDERITLTGTPKARFIRMKSRRRALDAYGISMYEFEVYGTGEESGLREISTDADASGYADTYDLLGRRATPGSRGILITPAGKRINP